ncbi:BPSL0067 family protein [Nitrospirillum sp. BR 11163]|uniref:BPSL0067 family protein n=1 Tax=Nitrospirillum sp. BR 11163 TaxID=3104323 RepID=UPI002AFF70AB|nr:BPSL0067 family protein [Nitrospirillum sp. BR 11163]MEA1676073.1 BPSL0067 family protein [Nitrospirillum sp. BR 11163]
MEIAVMPYVYNDAMSLLTNPIKPNVGTGQCVALVQAFTSAGRTASWKQGAPVRGNTSLRIGTAIATFVNGQYPNHAHGNHAAFYVSQDSTGIWVIDQFTNSGGIQKRHLLFRGQNADGTYIEPSRNGDAFSVIE